MVPAARGGSDVERVARHALGRADVAVQEQLAGLSNTAWPLVDGDGGRYVLKQGPLTSAAKWTSSHRALTLAGEAGIPVPELRFAGEVDGSLVRVLTWIDGTPADQAPLGEAEVGRMIGSLGAAIGALHRRRVDGFSSRLDGSAPTFRRWADYLEHRMRGIAGRCQEAGLDPALVDRVGTEVARLAGRVGGAAEPVVCHRALHLGNLILAADGSLAGIIDWDAAEPWDRAGDWFKLEYEVLRAHPDRADDLRSAYLDGGPVPAHWDERRRIVHLVEALNTLPNAVGRGWGDEFADRARRHLDALLTGSG